MFSLINVYVQIGEHVTGTWLQDHIGTLESAVLAAQQIEAANGHHIVVAVVAPVASTMPTLAGPYINLRRLDPSL